MEWSPLNTTRSALRPTRPEAPDTLDDGTLHRLAQETSPEMVPRIISIFLSEIRKRQKSLLEGFSDHNPDAVHHQVHAIKSGAGTFGAARLQWFAREADALFKAGDTDKALALAKTLPDRIDEAVQALSARFHLE